MLQNKKLVDFYSKNVNLQFKKGCLAQMCQTFPKCRGNYKFMALCF